MDGIEAEKANLVFFGYLGPDITNIDEDAMWVVAVDPQTGETIFWETMLRKDFFESPQAPDSP